MSIADQNTYLAELCRVMRIPSPGNRTVNIVCHGHSVPAGYFATPVVDTFNAYPHLLHVALKERHPNAVINVIVTAIGGETSETGAERFEREVLTHRPDLVTIDYALNDRTIGAARALENWTRMVQSAKAYGTRVILLTPTPDALRRAGTPVDPAMDLDPHAEQIRRLASDYEVGLADSLAAFDEACRRGEELNGLLGWVNHPSRRGHELVTRELLRWFPLPRYEDVL